MNLAEMIAERQARLDGLIARRDALTEEGNAILARAAAAERTEPTAEERARNLDIAQERGSLSSQITALEADIAQLRELVDEERGNDEEQQRSTPTGRGYDQQARTTEQRTYSRESDRRGIQFANDVVRSFVSGDLQARERLARHMQEELVERGKIVDRAVGTSAFSGLVVPQYLVDEFAPVARAGRPLADAMRHHDLPETGMTISIGRGTTGTSTANQANQGDNVSETDFDDTLLTIPVQTAAGSQTIWRQALDRGVGVEDTVMEDLIRSYDTNLDSTIINQAVTGLSAIATAITYTDASPTAAELYPKLLQGPAAVEALLLDQSAGDTFAVFHSRRWYWAQSQLTSTWPMFGQPGVSPQLGGENYAETYGRGYRGLLPAGTPVVTDNNIPVNLGAGTNEDEIYFVAKSEAHLWEDPNAPMFIRAEQTQAKKLGVDLVVYGYFAYTFARRPHAQKISGTGLVTPTF